MKTGERGRGVRQEKCCGFALTSEALWFHSEDGGRAVMCGSYSNQSSATKDGRRYRICFSFAVSERFYKWNFSC